MPDCGRRTGVRYKGAMLGTEQLKRLKIAEMETVSFGSARQGRGISITLKICLNRKALTGELVEFFLTLCILKEKGKKHLILS